MKKIAIWGIAGAGKTTFLSRLLKGEEKIDGLPKFTKENTYCISFSRMARYSLESKLQDDWKVYTFHSFCAKLLLQNDKFKVLKHNLLSQFFTSRGFGAIEYETSDEYSFNDHIYSDINKYRLLDITPEEYYERTDIEKTPALEEMSMHEWVKLCNDFQEYMNMHGLDYTETLRRAINIKIHIPVLVVDEANDLSPIMWKLINVWKIDNLLLVGDPNQNIYEFAGSKPDFLASVKPIYELTTSYRVPENILQYACNYLVFPFSGKIKGQNTGVLEFIDDYASVVNRYLQKHKQDKQTSMYLLTFTRKKAREYHSKLLQADVPHKLFNESPVPAMSKRLFILYHYPDLLTLYDLKQILSVSPYPNKTKLIASMPKNNTYLQMTKALKINIFKSVIEYLQKLKPEQFKLKDKDKDWYYQIEKNPKWISTHVNLNISTIHSVKGGESDIVYVDFNYPKRYAYSDEYLKRVYYVACTRAKKELYINPSTELHV